jgi:tetratricopeptide (TPR) repeat protein
MKATKSFLAAMGAHWARDPGQALRMVAEPADRGAVVKALRLAELSPGNKRPLFLYEAPFLDQGDYFAGLARAIEADYLALRAGVAAEGVILPPFFLTSSAGEARYLPLERALRAVDRASILLGPRFDGLTLALVPERIASTAIYRTSAAAIGGAPFGERGRVAIFDPGGHTLGRVLELRQARFHVNAAELGAFLAQLGQRPSRGPGAVEPPPSSLLRDHLTAAARATEQARHEDAIAHYRAARAIYRAAQRTLEEATVLIALAGAFLAAETPALAMTAYEDAAALALKANAWALAAQARLGAGGAAMGMEGYVDAAIGYRAAAEAATQAEVPELVQEARRMEAICRDLAARAPRRDPRELAW